MAQISGYKLIGKIGEGGMATVYKGVQVSLNRPVAIKVLSKKMREHSEVNERFKRESLIIARINHPNIIHVIDRGITPNEMPYFVMEYVEGIDLALKIHQGDLDFNRKLELSIQTCKALAYAHKNGVIHRDLKPGNILIDDEENARLLDFGIAQFYEDEGEADKTRPGIVMGTLPYMSPEQQISADCVTTLSDLYSLGVVMYELFTGQKPLGRFKLPTEIDPNIPKPLEEIIMKCLDQDSENRPSSADEIKDILLKLLRGAHLEDDQRQRASEGFLPVKDRFALLDIIKEDGHGAVYLYEEKKAHNLLIIRKRSSSSTGYKEAKLLATLKHKNIVSVLGVSRNEELFIIVMEYLSGGSLGDRLIKPHPLGEFLKSAREICEGMAFAHKNRITHGNLRPSNILFTQNGHAKIADFGLSEHYGKNQQGKNWYNIFEEARSVQADIFAAGVIFYQMATGALPPCVTEKKMNPRQFDKLPLELQEMLSTMLSRKPESRQSSFDNIITEIDNVISAYMEATTLDDQTLLGPTEFLDNETGIEDEKASAKKRPRWRRIFWTFFFLFILAVTALNYLITTGQLDTYLGGFIEQWNALMEMLKTFWNDTVVPLWNESMERLQNFVDNDLRPFLNKIAGAIRKLTK